MLDELLEVLTDEKGRDLLRLLNNRKDVDQALWASTC